MKKKLLVGVISAVLLLGGATTVMAATFQSPAEIYAALKGVTVDEAYAGKAAGKSFGAMAKEAGVLEEFQAKMLENKKAILQERVDSGQLTLEQADAAIKNLETNLANCDGTSLGQKGCGVGGGCYGQGAGANAAQGTGDLSQGKRGPGMMRGGMGRSF